MFHHNTSYENENTSATIRLKFKVWQEQEEAKRAKRAKRVFGCASALGDGKMPTRKKTLDRGKQQYYFHSVLAQWYCIARYSGEDKCC
jgi:hypothetical protein